MATKSPVPALDDDPEMISPTPAAVQMDSADRNAFESSYKATERSLQAQKKVRIRVPVDTRVQINGYGFYLAGKQWVEVPQQVADILEEAGRL
jgi:hypothetical protein